MKRLLLFLLLAIPGACYGDSELLWNYRIGSGVWTIDMSGDGDYIAAGTFTTASTGYGHGTSRYGYGIYLFDKSGALLWKYDTEDVVWSVSITDDGRYIAAGSKDNHVYLFDRSGALLWKYKTDDTVWTVAISSNGDYIAAGSYDKHVYLFDRSGALLWKYKTDGTVLSTSISSNGDYIAAGSYDNHVYLFDRSGALLWKYKTDDIVLSTPISSNGDYIAAGSYDNHVYLFDRSGSLLFKYRTNNVVLTTSISSNGDYIAAGSYDNNVYMFDKYGTLLFKYKTEDEVWDVAISLDGSRISAASKDSSVYFFSSSGDLLGKYRTGGYVSSVAISKNGDYTTAGSYDRSIYFFRIGPVSPVEPETPRLDVSKTVTEPSLTTGENITVLIELKNIGEGIARNIEFEDEVPEGFVLVAGKLSSMTELGPGESKTFSYTLKALEIKEQKEVALPAINVSYSDIKGNPYTARSSAVFITLIPGEMPVSGIGVRESLKTAVSSILKTASINRNTIFIVLAAIFLFAAVKKVRSGRRYRRKIDKAEILTKIRKEAGVAWLEPSKTLPKDSGRVSREAPAPVVTTKVWMEPRPAVLSKPRFGKPIYRKETVNLLKKLKGEIKK